MIKNAKPDNERTLQSYQNKTEEYVKGTPQIDQTIKDWLDSSLSLLPKNAKILEVGSGFGRDAEYVRDKGCDIECSDAVENFVAILQSKGFSARLINLLTDEINPGYDMILADAVLLHFSPEEAALVARKIHAALNKGGIFALRMKQGEGPKWSEEKLGQPRYFYFWKPEDLKTTLADTGFDWLSSTDSHTSHNNADWLHIIARKTRH